MREENNYLNLNLPESELKLLTGDQKGFLLDAHNGSMRYCLNDDGSVCAWGVAWEAIFSMHVEIESHPFDGYMVTLPTD